MENKKLYIGLGVLAIAGIGYYIWKKNKPENKSNVTSCPTGYHLVKGNCYVNTETSTHTKSLYE